MKAFTTLHEDDEYIYHLCPAMDWQQAQALGSYSCASLQEEGFIHFSYARQVRGTWERLFQGKTGMVLLEVLRNRSGLDVRDEDLYDMDQDFPHVYEVLPVAAVIRVIPVDE